MILIDYFVANFFVSKCMNVTMCGILYTCTHDVVHFTYLLYVADCHPLESRNNFRLVNVLNSHFCGKNTMSGNGSRYCREDGS